MNEEVKTKAEKRMLEMIADMKVCEEIAERTYRLVSFPPSYRKVLNDGGGHCFRIILPKNQMVKAVSCSIPPDANRGISERQRTYSNLEIKFETALIGEDDDVIYIDALGYNDIKRFDSSWKVVEEVMRVADEICGRGCY
jgi:hypothetical protein